jgi:ribosomal protein S12 methylthiotransferase
MKRGGGPELFLRSMEKIRKAIPDVTLRTSLIVGFPGETEKEFEELCDFVRAVEFDWLGCFSYSDQEGAGAFSLDSKISAREVERRRKHVMQVQRRISRKKKRALVGKRFELLMEGPSQESELLLEGRTCMHAPEIDGKVFVNDVADGMPIQSGQFYRCVITEAHDYDLVAKII